MMHPLAYFHPWPTSRAIARLASSLKACLLLLFLATPLLSWAQSNSCINPPAGLIAWWSAEGNATDFTSAHSGTFPYGSAFTAGQVGQAFDFDGSYRRVSVADSPAFALTNAMTLEAWVYPRAYGGFITFRGDNRGGLDTWVIDTYESGYVKFQIDDEANNYQSVRAPLALNQWQHVAATWDRASGDMKIYLNGALVQQTNTTIIPIGVLDPGSEPAIGIGNHSGTFHQFPFNGLVDELAIYNRALTANEIASIYTAGSAGKCPGNTETSLINVDFGQDLAGSAKTGFAARGLTTNDFWNFYTRDDGAGGWRTFGTLTNLKTASGVTTEVVMTVANAPGSWGNGSTDPMYVGYIYPFNGGNITITLTNLPTGRYDLLPYASDGNFELSVGGNSLGVKTSLENVITNPPNWTAGVQYAPFTNVEVTAGQSLVLTVRPGIYGYAIISGLQISATTTTITPSTSCQPTPSGVISWWRGESNLVDSVQANHGASFGGVSFVPGKVGTGLGFDGTGYVVIPHHPSLNCSNALTIELWFKPENMLSYGLIDKRIGGTGANYGINNSSFAGMGVYYDDATVLDGDDTPYASVFETSRYLPIPTTGVFHHLAATYQQVASNSVQLETYLDGQKVRTRIIAGNLANTINTTPVTIGATAQGAGEFFTGVIDEIAIYSRVLSSAEVASIYNAASAGKCPPSETPPSITQQPQSTTVAANTSAQFNVVATGVPAPTYQWFFAGNALVGQTNATLLLNNVLPAQAGNYFVTVTNSAGGLASSTATLSVITTQAVVYVDGNTPGCYNDSLGTVLDGTAPQFPIPYGSGGGDPTFLPASEPDLTAATNILGNWFAPQLGLNSYWRSVATIPSTWELNTETAIIYLIDAGPNGIADLRADLDEDNGIYVWVNGEFKFGARLPGLPSPLGQFEHTNIFLGDLLPGSNYIQILREDSGIASGYQIRLTGTQLTTNQQPPEITQPPVAQSVELGNTATFTVAATGTPRLFYQWRFNGDNLAGQTNTSLVLPNLQLSQAGDYSVAVSNAYGSVTSSVAALTVLTFPPTITRQPTNITIFEGITANFAVQVTGTAPLFYQWFFNTTPLIGKTSAAFSIGNAQIPDSGNYLVIVSNAFGAVTSSVATLTVNPRPPCAPVHDGLVSWWRGENDLSDAWDSNNGTPISASYNNGKVGRAFVSPIIQVADAPSLRITNALTIEAWVNPTAVSGSTPRTIVAKYDYPFTGVGSQSSYYFGLTNGRVMFMLSGNGAARTNTTVFSSQTIPVNQWSHLAATYDGNAMRIFINGVMVTNRAYAGGIFAGNLNLGIGNVPPSPGFSSYSLPFSGMLDEVSLYQRALSEFEVQSIYNADLTGKCLAPPVITQQPQDQVVPLGEDVKFTATVLGSRPLRYQWQLNGTNILNATNTTLVLEKLKSNQTGNYSVFVTNAAGTAISSNALLALLPAPSCTETPAGLISWWPGDANTADAMGLNNILTYSPVSYPTGKVSSAFTFNGINSRIQINNSASLNFTNNQNFSIEMWIKAPFTNTTYANMPLLEKRDSFTSGWRGYSLSLHSGRLAFALGATGINTNAFHISSGPDLRDGMFHHVAVTLNRTATNGGVLYVDGSAVLAFNPTVFTNSLLNTLPLFIGAPTTTASNSFYFGLIDEPAIYNRALTSAEILAIRQAGAAGKCKTPPSLIVQPVSQKVAEGSNATFSVTASGSPLLRYQWLRNSQPISGATNLTYLTGVAATYSVRVTNLFGAILSSNAVLSINRRPVANPDTFTTASNTPATFAAAKLTLNDTDLDGDSLTVTSVSISGQNGTLSLVSGMVTYTPPAGFVGNKIFTYTVADALGGTAVGTVMVTIGAGGAAPLNIISGPTIDGSDFVVRFAGIPGLTYTIEAAPDPTGPWSKVANVAAPTTNQGLGIGIFEFREPIGTNTTRFYHTIYPSY